MENYHGGKDGHDRLATHYKRSERGVYVFLSDDLEHIAESGTRHAGVDYGEPRAYDVAPHGFFESEHKYHTYKGANVALYGGERDPVHARREFAHDEYVNGEARARGERKKVAFIYVAEAVAET